MWTMYFMISVTLLKIAPILVVACLNVVLIMRIRKMIQRRKIMNIIGSPSPNQSIEEIHQTRKAWTVTSRTSIKEQSLAVMTVYVAISFLLFTLPSNVASFVYNLPIEYLKDSIVSVYRPTIIITNFAESLHYAIKFYIYFWVHQEIRESCMDFLQVCINRNL